MSESPQTSSQSQQGSQVVTTHIKDLHLFGYWRSSSTWRVRIALAAKDLPFEYHSIDIFHGESKKDDYANNVNSMKQIPVLECMIASDTAQGKQIRIAQSLAIIEFIEEGFADIGESLLPENLVDRAKVREIAGKQILYTRGRCFDIQFIGSLSTRCTNILFLPDS
jgi:hypothetical protein